MTDTNSEAQAETDCWEEYHDRDGWPHEPMSLFMLRYSAHQLIQITNAFLEGHAALGSNPEQRLANLRENLGYWTRRFKFGERWLQAECNGECLPLEEIDAFVGEHGPPGQLH